MRISCTCLGTACLALAAALLFQATAVALEPANLDPSVAVQPHAMAPPPGWKQGDRVLYSAPDPFTPNDPYFSYSSPSGGQWGLQNQLPGGGPDINVVPAWNRGVTGQGVTIGIVDTGFETAHEDLAANYVAADSWNFGNNTPNANPIYPNAAYPNTDDNHATSVAGIAAARGGNGIGVTGVAPYGGLASLRVDFPQQTSQMFADATTYHSSGANTSIKVKNHSYGDAMGYQTYTPEVEALATSAAAGTIHAFAAGNERFYHTNYYFFDTNGNGDFDPKIDVAVDADANKKQPQNSPHAICVAALGANGKFASYSNWGANVFVTAPSWGWQNVPSWPPLSADYMVTTTDRSGNAGYNTSTDVYDSFPNTNYTSTFDGTSASTPVVAGVMALGKQVNPAMDVRMAKHLLARTSRVVDPTDSTDMGGWITNAAGYHFNENYGFGLIDADAFTRLAAQTARVTPQTHESTGTIDMGHTPIPDYPGAGNLNYGATALLFTGGDQPIEDIQVHLKITHPWRGELGARLTNVGTGTFSWLAYPNLLDSFEDIDWTFTTNAFWGEQPGSLWALQVFDFANVPIGTEPYVHTGFWESYSMDIHMGDMVLVPEPGTIGLLLSFVGAAGIWRMRSRHNRRQRGQRVANS